VWDVLKIHLTSKRAIRDRRGFWRVNHLIA